MTKFKKNGAERRMFVRIPFWFVTKYRLYNHGVSSQNAFRQGIGRNISAGGICFDAKESFEKDSILEVEIDMPALEHSVRVIGQVMWAHKQENTDTSVYGIVFREIDPQDVEAVKKIIETFS